MSTEEEPTGAFVGIATGSASSTRTRDVVIHAADRNRTIWSTLKLGDVLILRRHEISFHRGFIDDRTDDGRMIWITGSLSDRRLFHIEDDYDVTVVSRRQP